MLAPHIQSKSISVSSSNSLQSPRQKLAAPRVYIVGRQIAPNGYSGFGKQTPLLLRDICSPTRPYHPILPRTGYTLRIAQRSLADVYGRRSRLKIRFDFSPAMAGTRAKSGYTAAKPQVYTPTVGITTKRPTKKKAATKKASGSGVAKPKANTSKPRAKVATAGRVEKKKAAPKKKATVGDKVKGAIKKTAGKIEGKPGKKVKPTLLNLQGRRGRDANRCLSPFRRQAPRR